MDCRINILLVILMFSPQIAAAGLFDILDEQYITDISELPYSSGSPAVEWQESEYGHIQAWVDIVGFRNLSRDGDKYFINGDPVNLAIVQYDTKAWVSGSVQELTPTLTITTNNNYTVASLTVYLYWETMQCYDGDCWEVPHHETATFQDIEKSPELYDKTYKPRINIVEYNNTIEPKIAIQVQEPNASKVIIRYGNNSITHTLKTYHVNRTEKGIYYANITPLDTWQVQGQDIGRLGDSVLINTNISEVNYSKIEIIVSDIYGTTRADPAEFNITTVTYEPEKIVFNPLLIVFLGIVGTLFCSSAYIIRRIQL